MFWLTGRIMRYLGFFFVLTRGCAASLITEVKIPQVVRNGTGPIDLSCDYEIRRNENGLVVKWFHDSEQIYQWIPPMPPQDLGVIKGAAVYPEENLRYPNSRSVIRLTEARTEMAGEFACTVSTFQEEATRSGNMIVYAPEKEAWIHVSPFNESHTIFTCLVNGGFPRPSIRIYIEGTETKATDRGTETGQDRPEENPYLAKRHAIVPNFIDPALIDCEISIPETDYRNRERIVYYPARFMAQTSPAVIGKPSGSFYWPVLALIFNRWASRVDF